MLHQGKGIVLSSLRYGDSSLIVKILCREHGMLTFMVNAVHGKKSAIRKSMLQPGSLLEMVYYQKNGRQIQRMKEARCRPVLHRIQTSTIRTSIVIFISELLSKAIGSEERDEELFDLAENTILDLETNESVPPLFLHYFMLKLCGLLGFAPDENSKGNWFYLEEGRFSTVEVQRPDVLTQEQSSLFRHLISGDGSALKRSERAVLLDILLDYFGFHIPQFPELKSLPVIRSVFS